MSTWICQAGVSGGGLFPPVLPAVSGAASDRQETLTALIERLFPRPILLPAHQLIAVSLSLADHFSSLTPPRHLALPPQPSSSAPRSTSQTDARG